MGLRHTDECLAKVADDEPIFVLRAQDNLAPELVRLWASKARMVGCPSDKVNEAYDLALRMEAWAIEHGGKYPD